jgi:hypothetical protein
MAERPRQIVVCSCEDTIPLDANALRKTCKGDITDGRQFCRAELDRFRGLAAAGGDITVACTQEAPVFSDAVADNGNVRLSFVNIRENAGWSRDAKKAAPKIAALLAAAAEPVPDFPLVSMESEGVILIYGRDEKAIEAAELLKDHLDITVLISKPASLSPRRVTDFPVVKGTISAAKGNLGASR